VFFITLEIMIDAKRYERFQHLIWMSNPKSHLIKMAGSDGEDVDICLLDCGRRLNPGTDAAKQVRKTR